MTKNRNLPITSVLMICVLLYFPSLSWSASFNCSEAKGFIEKTICSDPALSQLDEELSNAYRNALDSANHPKSVITMQKTWIAKIRSTCTTTQCLENVYKKQITELNAVEKYSWKLFHDEKIGIEFEYPSNRTVKVNYHKNNISIIGDLIQSSVYIINFEIHAGNFEKTVTESSMFQKVDGVWYAGIGPGVSPPAESITGNGWQGIKTIITCGVPDKKTGFHAGGAGCLWAIISNGKRSIVADTQGQVGMDENTLKTLMSIKFLQ